MWVSDTTMHFKNAIFTRLREALRVDHPFAVAYSPWSNGTCERMVKEVPFSSLHPFRAASSGFRVG